MKELIFIFFKIYYRLKIFFYKPLVGGEAVAYVLHDSLFPVLILKMYGAKLGKNVRINRWIIMHETKNDFSNLNIGDNVHIGKCVMIDLSGKVTIGNRVGIGSHSKIFTHQNLGDSKLAELYPALQGDIYIPDDAVISTASTILYPTVIQAGTLVANNSVVVGTYDKPCVLVGNPARISKTF